MTNLFKNPLLDVPVENRKGLCVDIIDTDWSFLKTVSNKHGNLSITVNILITKLINECRKRGITDVSQLDQFQQLVLSVGFIPDDSTVVERGELEQLRIDSAEYQRIRASASGLRNRTSPRTSRQTDGRNVKRGTPSKSDGDKTSTDNASSVQGGSGEIDKTKNGQGE